MSILYFTSERFRSVEYDMGMIWWILLGLSSILMISQLVDEKKEWQPILINVAFLIVSIIGVIEYG